MEKKVRHQKRTRLEGAFGSSNNRVVVVKYISHLSDSRSPESDSLHDE